MLPIILNNIFTRHRKEMAAAEKAREKARLGQRLSSRAQEAQSPEPAQDEAPLKSPRAETQADKG
jgi:hypothetical protein